MENPPLKRTHFICFNALIPDSSAAAETLRRTGFLRVFKLFYNKGKGRRKRRGEGRETGKVEPKAGCRRV
uniref:Uncharacterized protein n=1 Tax=Nelumbo nucifera TaxID=4432 RepID=A0A822YV60_NELNU|nr:TPA_asm: hypothetical protein HUJ06_005276 [Nelumbo nucifera]